MRVTKAIIPAAGLGTRFLPITKSVPKELLPIIDRAAIQYVVEEAASAGIEQVILVTSSDKESIRHYFDRDIELENVLRSRGDSSRLSTLRELHEIVDVISVRQSKQLGLGHAILCASNTIGAEPFVVMLPDDIILGPPNTTAQMIEVFDQYQSSVIAVQEVTGQEIENYGVITPEIISDGIFKVLATVEKPAFDKAPSNLGIVGRYVLTSEIFDTLAAVKPGALGEIQLTDALSMLIEYQEIVACLVRGPRYDVGNPMGLLKASVSIAIQDQETGQEFADFLRTLLD